jgi:hypothetical protein
VRRKSRKVQKRSNKAREAVVRRPRLFGRVDTLVGEMPTAHPNGRGDDHGGPRSRADGREPEYRVELICRTYAGDLGARPITDPNFVFWESPDIWIEGPSGDPDQAVTGVPNTVKVHVWNSGLANCWAATVDLFWCDPSVGIDMAHANPIGSVTLPVYSQQDAIAAFTWVPGMLNGGHECLVAQVYEPVSDPLVAPFQPKLDRHVAQRNVSVVQVQAGKSFSLPFSVPNRSVLMATSSLKLEAVTGSALQMLAMSTGLDVSTAAPRAEGGLVFRGIEKLPETKAPAVRFRNAMGTRAGGTAELRESLMLGAKAAASIGRPMDTRSRRMSREEPLRARQVEVPPSSVGRFELQGRLLPSSRRGGIVAYRVVERVGETITGGVTLLLKSR